FFCSGGLFDQALQALLQSQQRRLVLVRGAMDRILKSGFFAWLRCDRFICLYRRFRLNRCIRLYCHRNLFGCLGGSSINFGCCRRSHKSRPSLIRPRIIADGCYNHSRLFSPLPATTKRTIAVPHKVVFMLSQQVKDEIQAAYKQILANKSLRPRTGQRLMIAEIAKALADIPASDPESESDDDDNKDQDRQGPVVVVEAGTGTGKTLAYVLGTLPLAKHLGKKVVLATATVALQEQVTLRDLPDLLTHSGLSFSYVLAKGRGRYLCLSRLDQLLRGNDSERAMLELFGEMLGDGDSGNKALYERMLEKISAGQWKGDRDDWPEIISDRDWAPVTVE